jgi:heme-degrading monooxygenase HmoA
MSVIVVARLKVDPDRLEGLFGSHKDTFEAIAADAKKMGCLHHRFLAGDGEAVIVDEWDTAEAFQQFFAGDSRIATLMESAGVAAPPEVLLYRQMDSPDRF